jgi:hypothetical protein
MVGKRPGEHGAIRSPEEWALEHAEGGGPFTTRVTWRLPDGGTATWASRAARKRGTIDLASKVGEPSAAPAAAPEIARRLRRVNPVAATSFAIGGSLFAIGAALAQTAAVSVTAYVSVYMVGGVFFSSGGYASLLQVVNGPRGVGPDGSLTAERWRWWSYEPNRSRSATAGPAGAAAISAGGSSPSTSSARSSS